MANGALPHCFDALRLTFGNVVDAIKQEHKRISDEQKACKEAEEAEKRVAIEVEKRAAAAATQLMARPTLKCQRNKRNNCREVSIQDTLYGNGCSSCGNSLVCSKCNQGWEGSNTCGGCDEVFR